MAQKSRFSRNGQGFTLIELLVVIGIIALLLSIGTAAAVKITGEARREQVRSMMNGLIGANEEFKAIRKEGDVNHAGSSPINWADAANDGGSQSSCERFVSAVSTIQSAETSLMAAVNSAGQESFQRTFRDSDGDGHNQIFDRWGTELEYRSSNNGSGQGPNGGTQNRLLPLSRSPFFVSAGQDKTFGTEDDLTTLNGEPEYAP